MRISDWSSDVCSSDLDDRGVARGPQFDTSIIMAQAALMGEGVALAPPAMFESELADGRLVQPFAVDVDVGAYWLTRPATRDASLRSEEHTSELQSLMRISYAVFCLKKKKQTNTILNYKKQSVTPNHSSPSSIK